MRTLFARAHLRVPLVDRLVASGVLLALMLFALPAFANESSHIDDATAFEPGHKSEMKIPPGSPLPVKRKITVGVDKSMLVEVPADLSNVMVSNPEVLDAVVQTSRQVYLLGKADGEANAFFIGPDGQKVLFLEVTVTRDLGALQDSLARLIPGSKIDAEMMGENVVLSGSVVNSVDAARAAELAGRFIKKTTNVVNMLETAAKDQVMLKVQVAEVNRDAIRRLGVNMPISQVAGGNLTFTKLITNAFPITGVAVPAIEAGSAFQAAWNNGNGDNVRALVQALERTGAFRTLAEPTLTALSGETAKFHAGGEFPIPIAQDDNTITVQFKEFGIRVSFKPVVMTEGKISLTIQAEVSEISTEGAITIGALSIPGLRVRRAETTLDMPSGGTLAMAGLLSEDTRQSVEGVPGLKQVPVLGALFRSNDYRMRETELVILVTPLLATHTSPQLVAKPTDELMPSSELKELFFGHINRIYGHEGDPASYHGNYGYIIDYPGVKG